MFFFTICDYFFILQNIQTHQIKANQMHRVFVQMGFIFLAVAGGKLFICTEDICQMAQNCAEVTGGIIVNMDIRQNFTI